MHPPSVGLVEGGGAIPTRGVGLMDQPNVTVIAQ